MSKVSSDLNIVCCAGTAHLPADVLTLHAAMVQRTASVHVLPAALKAVKDAQSHAECLKALQHLQMLCSTRAVGFFLMNPNFICRAVLTTPIHCISKQCVWPDHTRSTRTAVMVQHVRFSFCHSVKP